FQFLGERFVGVQDGSYLVMLVVVMAALFAARARRQIADVLMAVAIPMKLAPLFYTGQVVRLPRPTAVLLVAIVFARLALPHFLWASYPYIYSYGAGLKGSHWNHVFAVIVAPAFAAAVGHVAWRAGFDMEDRIGWSLVPMAMYFAVYTNGARHLIL